MYVVEVREGEVSFYTIYSIPEEVPCKQFNLNTQYVRT